MHQFCLVYVSAFFALITRCLRIFGEVKILETTNGGTIRARRSYARNQQIMKMPNLIDVQRDSYKWFLDHGLHEIFEDVFPIQDFTGSLVLEYVGYSLGKPKYELDECENVTLVMPRHLRWACV